MSSSDPYPHRWFGSWADPDDTDEPSGLLPKLEDWQRPGVFTPAEAGATARYLSTAHVLWARTRLWPCPVCDTDELPRSLCGRTDGVWTWDDSLAHLVRAHDVVVPAGLRERVARFGGDPPPVTRAQIEDLSISPYWSPEIVWGSTGAAARRSAGDA